MINNKVDSANAGRQALVALMILVMLAIVGINSAYAGYKGGNPNDRNNNGICEIGRAHV